MVAVVESQQTQPSDRTVDFARGKEHIRLVVGSHHYLFGNSIQLWFFHGVSLHIIDAEDQKDLFR